MVNNSTIETTAAALANGHRLAIVEALATGPRTSSQLAEATQLQLNALAKHLPPLARAGLITSAKHGRTVTHTLNPAPLEQLADWAASRSRFWTAQLDALATALEETP